MAENEKQTTKERLKDITDSIERGIQDLFQSDKYAEYLRPMSRFHKYSVNNTMLIYMQKPDATLVAGFNKWRDQFERNVMKGEKGIKIIAPTPFKKKIEQEKRDPDTNLLCLIFAEILSGKGTHKIANELNRRKVPTKKGGCWTSTTIHGMVSNEKYTGDVIFQKTYTDEHFNRHNNNGEKDQYLIRNHHEPIISHEDFETAQDIIDQRGKEKGLEKQNTKYQNRYPFSGKIICGQCGGTFKRRSHSSGRHRIAWCCSTHIADIKKCSMKYVPESEIEYAFVTMMNKLIFGHAVVLKPLLVSLRGMSSDETLESIQAIDKKLEENVEQRNVLVGLMTKKYLEPAVYNKSNNELLQEAERLRRQKESITRFLNNDFRNLSEVSALLQYATKASMLEDFDGELFARFVERVFVYSRAEIGFELKCGITLKERLVG